MLRGAACVACGPIARARPQQASQLLPSSLGDAQAARVGPRRGRVKGLFPGTEESGVAEGKNSSWSCGTNYTSSTSESGRGGERTRRGEDRAAAGRGAWMTCPRRPPRRRAPRNTAASQPSRPLGGTVETGRPPRTPAGQLLRK